MYCDSLLHSSLTILGTNQTNQFPPSLEEELKNLLEEGLVFQRSVLGLSILMTNVKLLDFLQKYLAGLIYIIPSPGHTAGTKLLYTIPTAMRRQDEDTRIIVLHTEELRMVKSSPKTQRGLCIPF